jgi:hypothetical protein
MTVREAHGLRKSFGATVALDGVFLARQQLFPALMRKTGTLLLLSFLPLLMIFWLIRIRFKNAHPSEVIRSREPLIQSLIEKRV